MSESAQIVGEAWLKSRLAARTTVPMAPYPGKGVDRGILYRFFATGRVSRGSAASRLIQTEVIFEVVAVDTADTQETIRDLIGVIRSLDRLNGSVMDGAAEVGYVETCFIDRVINTPYLNESGQVRQRSGFAFRITVRA